MDGRDGHTVGQTEGRTYRRTDGQKDVRKDSRSGCTDGLITDRKIDEPTDIICLLQVKLFCDKLDCSNL